MTLRVLEVLRLFRYFGAFPIVLAYLVSTRSDQQAVEGGIAYEDHCFETLGSVRNTRHCLVEKLSIKLIDHFNQLRFGPRQRLVNNARVISSRLEILHAWRNWPHFLPRLKVERRIIFY